MQFVILSVCVSHMLQLGNPLTGNMPLCALHLYIMRYRAVSIKLSSNNIKRNLLKQWISYHLLVDAFYFQGQFFFSQLWYYKRASLLIEYLCICVSQFCSKLHTMVSGYPLAFAGILLCKVIQILFLFLPHIYNTLTTSICQQITLLAWNQDKKLPI